ncbi:MAG TPA: hypothetical protein VIK01_16095 [Polyangiaceae bacterium]
MAASTEKPAEPKTVTFIDRDTKGSNTKELGYKPPPRPVQTQAEAPKPVKK